MQKLDYNKFDFASVVKIDETSPSGLAWIAPRVFCGKLNYERVGTQAGYIKIFHNRQSYYTLVIFKHQFFVHRIVYALKHGSVDVTKDVDHIDGNSLNNSSMNLVLKIPTDNKRNARLRVDNKTGVTGVSLSTKGRGGYYYTAHWYDLDGIMKSKSFSINKLGADMAKSLAIVHREQQIQRLINEGACYTERHGT